MDTLRNPSTTDPRPAEPRGPRAPFGARSLRLPERPSESGMALFIVLVLVLVLTIVIFQLTYTTKIEERISKNREGFLEMSYSLQGFARSALQLLETDLLEDLGLIDDTTEEDQDGGNFGDFGPGADPGETVDPNTGETETERYDLRHEEWALEVEDQMNDVNATIRIFDGEGRISLNHLFEYPQYEDDEDEDDGSGLDIPDPGTGPDDARDEEEEEEWLPPTNEQREDAERILSRLIQSIIATNEDGGFDYYDTPDPDAAARAIVDYVYARIENENTRLIRSLEPIRNLPEVTWELFDGPRPDPDEEEEDQGFDEEDFIDDLGLDAGQLAGYENFEDGVEPIPRRLGLREFLTVHSTGKINLNTAPKQVLVALMLGFEDFDEATEIAELIEVHLNSYERGDEDDPSAEDRPPAEDGEEATEEFQKFTKFDDLGEVDETWTEGDATDDTILDLLRFDLEKLSVFKSTFFDVHIDGERDGRKISAVMGVARKEEDIIVLSWEESVR